MKIVAIVLSLMILASTVGAEVQDWSKREKTSALAIGAGLIGLAGGIALINYADEKDDAILEVYGVSAATLGGVSLAGGIYLQTITDEQYNQKMMIKKDFTF